MKLQVRRALISVFDKSGVVEFARELHAMGVTLLSTGGTSAALQAAGIPVTPVEEVTGFKEMLDGRVKTLHPAIHGGLLAARSEPAHMQHIADAGILPIDLVAINLYPFEQTVSAPGVTREEAIENIDIGGPSMIRSASKNHESVAAVTDPADYPVVLEELRSGGIRRETLRRLAAKAFRLTSHYDDAISTYLERECEQSSERTELPAELNLKLQKRRDLRYGENPHQQGALYCFHGPPSGLAAMEQLAGKELSYLNLFDVNGALELAWEFTDRPAAVVVKHASPCGVGMSDSAVDAYRKAYECDPVSAFGGIVALNRPLDLETAEYMWRHIEKGTFLEVIAAPEIHAEALELLSSRRKNIRLLKVPPAGGAQGLDRLLVRSVRGGVLVQTPDEGGLDLREARSVTTRLPSESELEQMQFAWRVVKHVKSNAIYICRDFQAVGIGGGQTARSKATESAVAMAGERARGGVLASDAFLPFPDSFEVAAKAGVTAIVQPGGSMRDEQVFAAADQAGIAMIVTDGQRHFRH